MDLIGINQQLEILTTMVSTWTSPTLRLFVNNYTVAPGDTIANYTEPTSEQTWYSPASITYGSPFIDETGSANVTAPLHQFNYGSGDSSPAVTIYGAFVVSPSTTLVSSYNFAEPVVMGSAGDAVLAGSQLQLPPNPQTPFVV